MKNLIRYIFLLIVTLGALVVPNLAIGLTTYGLGLAIYILWIIRAKCGKST